VTEKEIHIDATQTSSWIQTTSVNFRIPSPITGKNNASASLVNPGSFQLTLDTSRSLPVPKIFGPTELNLCSDGTYFQITADFSAGRVWKSAVINSVSPSFAGGSPPVNLATLSFFLDKGKLNNFGGPFAIPVFRRWTFTATVTNAFGVSSITPNFQLDVDLQGVIGKQAPVVIRGTAATRIFRSSDEIRLSAFAQIDNPCVPLAPPPDWQPQFFWQITSVPDENTRFDAGTPVGLGPLVTDKSELVIPPYFLRPKINSEVNVYAVRVNMTVDKFTMKGSAVTYLAIRHSLPIINFVVPAWVSNSTFLIVDARRSCDPDYATGCLPFVGRNNQTGSNFLDFEMHWEFMNPNTGDFSTPANEYEWDPDQDGYFLIGRHSPGIYRVTLRVSRVNYPAESFYVYRRVTVGVPGKGESASCITPNFSLPFFTTIAASLADSPPIAIQRDAPMMLRAVGVGLANSLNWSVETTPPQSSRLPATFSAFGDRPSLSVSSGVLYPGYSYSFRLQAGANCGGGIATGQVSFTVNEPPSGGVVQVSPQIGTGFSTVFTLTTGAWTVFDPNTLLPLTFEFQYLRKGARAPITLNSANPSPFLITRLAGPKAVCRLDPSAVAKLSTVNAMIVIARDTLGSAGSTMTTNFTINPLFGPLSPLTVFSTDLLPLNVLDGTKKSGANAEDQLRVLSMLAEEAAATECTAQNRSAIDQLALAGYRKEVGRQVLLLVQVVRGIFRVAGRPPSPTQLNLLVSALGSALSGAFSSFGQDELTLAGQLIGNLIQDALDSNTYNPIDVPVPVDYGPVLLDVISGLAKSLKYIRDEDEGFDPLDTTRRNRYLASTFRRSRRGNRKLEDSNTCDWRCSVIDNMQDGLRRLIAVLMTNFEPGSEPRIVKGSDVELKLSREFRTQVGNNAGVNQLDLDDGPKFHLPPNVLNDPRRIRNGPNNLPDTVDICAIRFRFNPLELTYEANEPPGVDLSKGLNKLKISGVVVPNFSIDEVHTLLFLNQLDSLENLDPYNLTERINITIPLPDDYEPPTDNKTQGIACGFWDESFDGWSAEGCTVLEIDMTNRQIVCSCNHASDFAAWNAFLANLGGGDIGVVATIAIVVVSILMPCLLAIWLLTFIWAANKDEEDSHAVHLGALVLLTKNRLRLHQQQRRFFQLLRENARRPAGEASATKKPLPAVTDGEIQKKQTFQTRSEQMCLGCLNKASLLGSWLMALKYEHSFFGIFTRFDPFYTRTQRVTVFTAVIVGNLFAASFFFEFKTANDLSPGVLIGSIIAAAFVVAIPIKISIRWLFRATEHDLGSPMHRVAQIYRISEFQAGDILPAYASEAERLDSMMLFAFKDFYAAKSNVVALQSLLAQLDEQERLASGASDSGLACWVKALSCRLWCRTQMKGGKATVEDRKRSMTARLGLKVDEKGDISRIEAEKSLFQAQARAEEALIKLKEACVASRNEWNRVPKRPNLRVETMRKQQSTLLRFASLLYDETEPRAKTRTKYLGHWFIYFAWTIIILYLIGGVAYCTRWVLGRTSYRGTVDSTASQTELETDANGIIVAWLLSAAVGVAIGVFLSEPVIQLIRFSVVPYLLRKFGSGTVRLWSRPATKVGIAPNDQDEDDMSKPVVGKPMITLAAHPGVQVAQEDSHLERQGTAKRASLLQEFKKKQKRHADNEAGSPVMEALADVVEALA